jgi:hypothetical protein
MDEDCPLAAAIRSGQRDDLMWAIFRKMQQITDTETARRTSPRSYYRDAAVRTHCVHGHEWVPENLVIRHGYPACRLCERVNLRRSRAKNPRRFGRTA